MGTHSGRTAVVTGAARGIGQAICARLAERGATVAGIDIADLAETEALVKKAGAGWIGARAANEIGHADILVNNAGIYGNVPWDELDWDTWRRYHHVNIDSHYWMCKAFVPSMKARGWGRIVNITSDSIQVGNTGAVAYKATKMAVIGFTRGLAGELAPYGITVNAASPSLTGTPGVLERFGEERWQAIAKRQLIKRPAVADDVTGLVLFLTSEDAHFVTGQTMFADGGLAFL